MAKYLIQLEIDLAKRITGLSGIIRKACLLALRKIAPGEPYALSILVCEDERIQELNRTYRGIDSTTDVLSFEDKYPLPGEKMTQLGDIAISYPAAVRQSIAAGHSLESEISLLAIHGTLHLLGYDHSTKSEKDQMWAIQHSCLEELGLDVNMLPDNNNDK